LALLFAVLAVSVSFLKLGWADPASGDIGKDVAERLQRGVDNPEREDNVFRLAEAVNGPEQVKSNMRKLFSKLLVSVSGGQVDKAYNPHLRDTMFSGANRASMADIRGKAGAVTQTWVPWWSVKGTWGCWICRNGLGGFQTACARCNELACVWAPVWPHREHIYSACCPTVAPVNTSIYKRFTQDSNFKTCCVKKEQVRETDELIACKSKNPLFNPVHAFNPRRGDGWAGLTEVDFWMNAIGLENARGTTMIATKDEVRSCIARSDQMMENAAAASWVSGAIERNAEWADKAGGDGSAGGGAAPGAGGVLPKVQEDIKDVRPRDKNLRFSDAVGEGGITVRPNVAVMERSERRQLARRFCFRPEQFYKLMNPAFDPLQREGGSDWQALMNPKMLWASYCPNGVELMTNPALSNIENVHRTPTDFQQGMKAWERDPMYCQRIHATQNANFQYFGFDKVLESSQSGEGVPNAQAVGHTCMEGGMLNTGMVPVTYGRSRVVEWRTAIADKMFGFLIAGTLAQQPSMMLPWRGPSPTPSKSYLKGFEPRPYSFKGPQPPAPTHATFIGKQFVGGGTNELGDICVTVNGDSYQFQNRSDGLYLSDYTHKPFTQEFLFNSQKPSQFTGLDSAFNKYVQEWAKDDIKSQKEIARRDIDKDGSNMSDTSRDRNIHNYASTSRIVAVCPQGYNRWRPPADAHSANLVANLDLLCREENFGSPVYHEAP
jgi:hypothetical protein